MSYREAKQDSEEEGELADSDPEDQEQELSENKMEEQIIKTENNNERNRKQKIRNNIWSTVLTEQTSSDITSMVAAVGVKKMVSRGPESFDATPLRTDNDLDIREVEKLLDKRKEEILDSLNGNGREKKGRGKKVPFYKPGKSVKLNRKRELTDDDDAEIVAEEISFRLWEPKRDLIKSIVDAIGVKKSIEIYNTTEKIEFEGGMLTNKGDRRRTPGGAFICKLRDDEEIDQTVIKEILELNNQKNFRFKRKQNEKSAFGPTLPKQLKEDLQSYQEMAT